MSPAAVRLLLKLQAGALPFLQLRGLEEDSCMSWTFSALKATAQLWLLVELKGSVQLPHAWAGGSKGEGSGGPL